GRRTEKLEQETNALDRSEQLLDAPAGDAIAVANRLDSEGQTLPDGLGPSRPAALGVSLDLAYEVGRNPRRDPLEGGLRLRRLGPHRGRGRASPQVPCLLPSDPPKLHRTPSPGPNAGRFEQRQGVCRQGRTPCRVAPT